MQTITYSYNYGNVSPTVNIKYQQDIKKHVKKVSAATEKNHFIPSLKIITENAITGSQWAFKLVNIFIHSFVD